MSVFLLFCPTSGLFLNAGCKSENCIHRWQHPLPRCSVGCSWVTHGTTRLSWHCTPRLSTDLRTHTGRGAETPWECAGLIVSCCYTQIKAWRGIHCLDLTDTPSQLYLCCRRSPPQRTGVRWAQQLRALIDGPACCSRSSSGPSSGRNSRPSVRVKIHWNRLRHTRTRSRTPHLKGINTGVTHTPVEWGRLLSRGGPPSSVNLILKIILVIYPKHKN